jgi:hypothetical protein
VPVDRLPEAPGFNASAHSKALDTNIKRPDGTGYLVFGQDTPESLPPFVKWAKRTLRDKVNELVANVNSLRSDVNDVRSEADNRLDSLEGRVTALEEAPHTSPFP